MANASVDFILNPQETVDVDLTVTPDVTYQAVLDLSASTRNHDELSNRDLPDQHPTSAITGLDDTLGSLTESVSTIEGTIETYGDVVTHNADEFATAEQGSLADTALQAGDNVSELVNDAGYLRASSLNGYATEGYVNAEIGNITDILDGYGNIVTHNVNEFATAQQGQLADTALQPNDNISELTNDVGYVTSAAIPTNYVTTNTTQTITGEKVFRGIMSIPAGLTYIIAGHGGSKLGYFTYDIDGFSNITLQTMTASNRDINFKTNNSGKVKYKGKEIAIKEDVKDGKLALQRNGVDVGEFTANQSTDTTINITVPTQASDVNALPSSTKYGASLALSINSSTYVITAQLKDQNGDSLGSAQTIDLPLESVVVSGSYDDETKKIILTLQNGSTVEFSVADLVSGLQSEITADNMLDADLVDDSTSTNKFVTSSEKSAISTAVQPSDLATVATSGDYDDLLNKPTIPTVNDATLTIQKNGTSVGTFTANASSNVTANITVPTDTSDLTNGAGYITGITSGDVTTALGYTPYDSSNPSGYISGITSGDVTTALGYTPYDSSNPSGYISGITSGDVTTALGYTPADDSGVVKTTGNQSIAGTKTFTGNITSSGSAFKRTSAIDPTTTSGETEVMAFQVVNKNGTTVASYNATRSGTSNTNRQRVTNTNVSGANWYDLRVTVSDSAFGYASLECGNALTNRSLSYATSSTTLKYLPTMGWVNNPSTSTNVVHRSGAETITGQKEFTGGIKINNTGSTTYGMINQLSSGKVDWYCVDSGGSWIGNYIEMNPSYETVVRGATNVQLSGTTPATTNQTPTEDTTNSTQIDTVGARNTKINSVMNSILPTGTVLPYGGSSAPTGFLLCDGSAVSRTTYADLYAVIGDTYGSGDGSTTFNVPNLSTAVLPSSSTVSVVGNGNALGIVDDISTEEKQHNALIVGSGSSGFTSAKVPFAKFELSTPLAIGSQASSAQEFGTVRKALGVSTLPEWSGLTGSITGVTLNYIIRT